MTTHDWRYLVATTLGDRTIGEIPIGGVQMDWRLCGTGSLRGQIGVANATVGRMLQGIDGAACALNAYRDGELWWSGPIWGVVPARDNKGQCSQALQAATWESMFDHRNIIGDWPAATVDILGQAHYWLDEMQHFVDDADLGISYDSDTAGVTVTMGQYLLSGDIKYRRVIDDLAHTDPGFEYYIRVYQDGAVRRRHFVAVSPTITSGAAHRIDAPGAIISYSLPRDATKAGTHVWGVGASQNTGSAGTSQPLLAGPVVNTTAITAGYPRLDLMVSHTSTVDTPTLTSQATADLAAAAPPVTTPAITIRLDRTDITPDSIGDTIVAAITDPNYPSVDGSTPGRVVTGRLVGLGVTPMDRSGAETATLILN